ncbi:hypothetical protein [Actinomadura alba]|uniref:Uncharacterized protein n=1 Tax=Actinomadura alba TaxID=406431 RepID=A0ABR7LNB0_9ACTN|nr:hypothetical protein [Actinomadura alba]MBC6465985.1 hypothetical protein [Actinomadura alba]
MAADEIARPLVRDWNPDRSDDPSITGIKVLVSRFEVDALAVAVRLARSRPGPCGSLFGELDAVTASEVLADLTHLQGAAL